MGEHVVILNSATVVAAEVASFLRERELLRSTDSGPGRTSLFVTDMPRSFDVSAARFLGGSPESARLIDL